MGHKSFTTWNEAIACDEIWCSVTLFERLGHRFVLFSHFYLVWMSLEDERFSKRSKHILSVDVHTSWQVIYNPYFARDLKMLKISKQDAITMFYIHISFLDIYTYIYIYFYLFVIYIYD
jgi:hypothetical protein